MPGKPAPKCDEKGNFVASQFYPSTGEKYCVIPDGREISGTRTSPGDKAFDCGKITTHILTIILILNQSIHERIILTTKRIDCVYNN